MPDFTVVRRGSDTSGRPLFATAYMWEWWDRCCRELGFEPTIVQGAFMSRAGGGAAASAGYHDLGGCFDLRLWDRTSTQRQQMIRVFRSHGAAYWERDQRHGMDLHAHLLLGTDQPLASGAAYQWQQYVQGRDGLASGGPDYHWRPNPLAIKPPPEDELSQYADDLEQIKSDLVWIKKRLDKKGAIRRQLATVRGLIKKQGDGSPRA